MRNSGKYLIEDKDDKVRDVDNFTTVLNLKWGDLFCVTRHTLPCNRLLCYSTALRRPSDNYFVCPANLLATGFVYLRLSMDIYNGHLVLMFVSFICAVTLSCRNSCLTYAYLYMSAVYSMVSDVTSDSNSDNADTIVTLPCLDATAHCHG